MSIICRWRCSVIVQFRIPRSFWETAGFPSSKHNFCIGTRLTLYKLPFFAFLSLKKDHKKDKSRRKERSRGKECAADACSGFEYNSDGSRSGLHFFKIQPKQVVARSTRRFPRKRESCNIWEAFSKTRHNKRCWKNEVQIKKRYDKCFGVYVLQILWHWIGHYRIGMCLYGGLLNWDCRIV